MPDASNTPHQTPAPNHTPRRPQRLSRFAKQHAISVGVFVFFAGLLFWTKLKAVHDLPRSAYADPRETNTGDEVEATSTTPTGTTSTGQDDQADEEPADQSKITQP